MTHLRKLLLATVAAAVLVGFVATFASAAAKPSNPQITFTDPASDGGLLTTGAVQFTYNRIPNATKTLTCATSGPNGYASSGCTTPQAGVKGASTASSQPYVGVTQGSYTFTVTLTLTDGGTTSATVHFRIPLFTEVSPTAHTYTYNSEFLPAKSTGNVTADMQPAGGIVIPPTPAPSSTSGCTASDFNGFVSGRVALIQRGGCNFGVKVLNAQAAGASGVVIFNEGQVGRTAVLGIALLDAGGNEFTPPIPVAFTSFAVGSNLYSQYQDAVANSTVLPSLHLDYDS
jgi:PA domain